VTAAEQKRSEYSVELPRLCEIDGLEVLESSLGKPIRRNSVLDGFGVRRLAAIQSEICWRIS
jgi:hypothetical protein